MGKSSKRRTQVAPEGSDVEMAMTREKKRLVMHKIRMMHPSIDIKRSDIIPLIHKAWTVSFARKEQNLHAIIARGWYHLDMRLLKDTDILNTRVAHVNTPERTTAASDDSGTPPTPRTAGTPELVDCNATADNIGPLALLNMNVGNSEIMIDLVQYMRKNAGAQAALQERKRKVALRGNAHEGFLKDSKFTAGGIFKSGQAQLQTNHCESTCHMVQRSEDEGRQDPKAEGSPDCIDGKLGWATDPDAQTTSS